MALLPFSNAPGSLNVSAGATSNNLTQVTFSNSNGLAFGLNGSTMTGSYTVPSIAGLISAINVSGGSTSNNLSAITFSNSNGLAFGLNGSTMTGSYTVPSGVAIAASNATFTSGTVVMSNNGGAPLTISSGAQSVLFSVPAISSMVGTAGVSFSTNGSTITGSIHPMLSRSLYPDRMLTLISAPANASYSIQYVNADNWITATRLDALVSWSAGTSAAANTAAIALTAIAGIYTLNGQTLSSVSSGSTHTTYQYASNSASWSSINSAIRPISVPVNINMTPGEYYVGFGFSTNSSSVGTATTNLAQTLSMYGGNQIATALNYGEIGALTATSVNWYSGMGILSATTNAVPVSISLANINQTGANISQANIALVFRNY
ncbi:MAG TPA: hypothetical protein VMR34_01170 [Candidatus Saccharimonadales bacterium]|nr:hypothetical protein [Candidatus Saccharimonadales bacterium]